MSGSAASALDRQSEAGGNYLFRIRGLTKGFGEHPVLEGIDLDIPQHEFITIIGPSGGGKSLLMKILIGLIDFDEGTVWYRDHTLDPDDEKQWVELRHDVGMSFQEIALFDSMSVFENVAYGLIEQNKMSDEEIGQRVAESLQQVGLAGIEALMPSSLSGGMRRRVGIARAIAMRPAVLFLDEPTEGLDPINVTRVNRLMRSVHQTLRTTTIVATHNLRSAFATSDRIVMINEGRVHFSGTPEQVMQSKDEVVRKFVGTRVQMPTQADRKL